MFSSAPSDGTQWALSAGVGSSTCGAGPGVKQIELLTLHMYMCKLLHMEAYYGYKFGN
jgi:hypothetical protein